MNKGEKLAIGISLAASGGLLLASLALHWSLAALCGTSALILLSVAAMTFASSEAGAIFGVCHPHRAEVPITARYATKSLGANTIETEGAAAIPVPNWPRRAAPVGIDAGGDA